MQTVKLYEKVTGSERREVMVLSTAVIALGILLLKTVKLTMKTYLHLKFFSCWKNVLWFRKSHSDLSCQSFMAEKQKAVEFIHVS